MYSNLDDRREEPNPRLERGAPLDENPSGEERIGDNAAGEDPIKEDEEEAIIYSRLT
jgi:hypothetical protein